MFKYTLEVHKCYKTWLSIFPNKAKRNRLIGTYPHLWTHNHFAQHWKGCFKSLWKTKHNQLFMLASPRVHCVAFRTEPPEAVLKRGHVNRFSKGFTEACGKQRAQRVCQANRNKYSGIGSFNRMKYDNLPKMKCMSACPGVCVWERLLQNAFLLTVVLNWLAMTQK